METGRDNYFISFTYQFIKNFVLVTVIDCFIRKIVEETNLNLGVFVL